MIFAAVYFIAHGVPIYSMRSRETFATLAECQAFIIREELRLFILAAQATAQSGQTVTVRAECIGGQDA